MDRVTIKDIATASGVSVGTVSKVLNGDKTVKDRNVRSVEQAVHTLNYNVNNVARSLARKPIKIGILLPYLFESYLDPVVEGINRGIVSLSDHKVTAEFCKCSLHSDEKTMTQCLQQLINKGVNGILFGPFHRFSNVDQLAILRDSKLPTVILLSDIKENHRLAYVGIDADISGEMAADLATIVLKEQESIAVFVGRKDFEEHKIKAESFRNSISTENNRVIVFETHDDAELAYQLAVQHIQTTPDLGLIYVATANSLPVCKAICDCSKEKQIKVIVTDVWQDLRPYIENGLIIGALDQNLEKQGYVAVRTLHDYLVTGKLDTMKTKVSPNLLLHKSMLRKLDQ